MLYKCDECEKEFFKSYRLTRHKISLHGIYPESRASSANNKIKATLADVDGQVQSLMIMSEGTINSLKFSTIFMLCGKEGQWNDIRNRIENKHIAAQGSLILASFVGRHSTPEISCSFMLVEYTNKPFMNTLSVQFLFGFNWPLFLPFKI